MTNFKIITTKNIILNYLDTDSFILTIQTKVIVRFLEKLQELPEKYEIFDCSNLDEKHKLFSHVYKKIPRNLKKETPKSFYVDKFIALMSKAYSIVVDNKNKNVSKGNKNYCKDEIAFEQFKKCLDREKPNQNIKKMY